MTTFSQQSMLDVAYNILDQRNEKMNLNDLIDQVFAEMNIEDPNSDIRTELYLEIMTSGNFVYLGHEEWDIKLKHSLKEYIKDPVEFLSKDELVIVDENETIDDLDDYTDYDSDEDESKDDEDDDSLFYTEGFGEENEDDDNFDDSDDYDDSKSFDEDEYDEYMDDYEDMYD